MQKILTPTELSFLASQGLGPEDVFDARRLPQWLWFRQIDEAGKTVALGAKCKRAGHRLRTRRGHCVQCDPKKLAFQARYRAEQYVYIAGSRSAKLIKVGTCIDTQQRENRLRAERYGGADDWEIIFTVWVKNAGAIEEAAHTSLSQYCVTRDYWKDGFRQTAIELLEMLVYRSEARADGGGRSMRSIICSVFRSLRILVYMSISLAAFDANLPEAQTMTEYENHQEVGCSGGRENQDKVASVNSTHDLQMHGNMA